MVSAVTLLQTRTAHLSHRVYDIIEYGSHIDNAAHYGEAVLEAMHMLPSGERAKCVSTFQAVYATSYTKLAAIWEKHPCQKIYELVRIFNPKQLPLLSVNKLDFVDLKGIAEIPGSEWHQYISLKNSDVPDDKTFNLNEWWLAQKERFSTLRVAAVPYIWLPVASAEVEYSFSQYKDVLQDDHQSLSEKSLCSFFTLNWPATTINLFGIL